MIEEMTIDYYHLDGAKIVSSREFCPETFRLNDRTKNDLGAIMRITYVKENLDHFIQYSSSSFY